MTEAEVAKAPTPTAAPSLDQGRFSRGAWLYRGAFSYSDPYPRRAMMHALLLVCAMAAPAAAPELIDGEILQAKAPWQLSGWDGTWILNIDPGGMCSCHHTIPGGRTEYWSGEWSLTRGVLEITERKKGRKEAPDGPPHTWRVRLRGKGRAWQGVATGDYGESRIRLESLKGR